jgi:hypothetical protein
MAEQAKQTQKEKSSEQMSTQNQPSRIDPEERQSGINRTMTKQTGQSAKQMTGTKQGNGDGVMRHVRSTATEAYDSATSKAAQKLEEQKATLSGGLSNVASNFRRLGEDLEANNADDQISRLTAEYSQLAANKLERAVGYFENKDVNAVYRDFENLARQYPAWFVGGAFAFGFLAARFLKSSDQRMYSSSGMSYRPVMTGQPRGSGTEMRTG